MKILVLGVFLISTASMAAGYGQAGCGLGSLVFGSSKGAVQIFAATTNGTSGSQTLGITSGTSNCDGMGLVLASRETKIFVTNNLDSLSKEMVQGSGENLDTLAALLGCNKASFANHVKGSYSSIISNDSNVDSILYNLGESIKGSSLECKPI